MARHLNQQQACWCLLAQFEFVVTPWMGIKNRKADTLSWKDQYYKPSGKTTSKILKPSNLISDTTVSDLLSSICSQLPSDPFTIQTVKP